MIFRGKEINLAEWIGRLIAEDNLHEFYTWSGWLNLREEILYADHHECQTCKKRGRYSRATTVHHLKHVKDFPALAMSKTFWEDGKEHRQLISVCDDCHRVEHPLPQRQTRQQLNQERW